MKKGNGKAALCPKLDITGPVSMKHLLENVYSRKDKKCRKFALAPGSKQFYSCPLVDTAGEELPMKHLLDKVYSKSNKDCQECGVCEAASKTAAPERNIVQITASPRARKDVRPAKHTRLHRKTITKTVAVGIGRR